MGERRGRGKPRNTNRGSRAETIGWGLTVGGGGEAAVGQGRGEKQRKSDNGNRTIMIRK